jgi:hypothetical protein
MEWFDPSPHIRSSRRITDIFGYWPTFHDAWIHRLDLSVADGAPWEPGSTSPILDLLIHVFEMTKEVNQQGYFVLTKHTLTRMRFENVEGLALRDFSFQNSIFELVFGIEPMSYPNGGGPLNGPPPNVLTVRINSSSGLSGQFKCLAAEIVSAEPCDEHGKLINSPN